MSQTLRKECTYDNLIIRFLLAVKNGPGRRILPANTYEAAVCIKKYDRALSRRQIAAYFRTT